MMRNGSFFLVCGVSLLAMISCSKETSIEGANSPAATALQGVWSFTSIHADTKSVNEYTDFGSVFSTVSVSDYTSINNTGTVVFSADSISEAGLGYSIADSVKAYDYQDGTLIDTLSGPFDVTVPPVNLTSAYKLIGTDSIYFPGGGLGGVQGLSATQTTAANGGRYVLSGNTLKITSHFISTDTTVITGIPVYMTDQATITTTLTKQ